MVQGIFLMYHIVEDQNLCVLVHKYSYFNVYFTITAPVKYLICQRKAEKSAKPKMLKCAGYLGE